MPASKNLTREVVAEVYERTGGNVSATARELGVARSTIQHHLRHLDRSKPLAGGQVDESTVEVRDLPGPGEVRRYILTCAQNNTRVHGPVLENLEALADYYDAEIMVGRFTYNQNAYGKLSVKPGTMKATNSELWYDEAVKDYVVDKAVELAPGLVWCGNMNTLPTAQRPLAGFENYTGRKSGIFPHVKFAMESIPSGKHEPTKFNYTTGTVTQRNYIQKRAGLKAEFHHCYGALLVEVTEDGWWVRQLNADARSRIFDIGGENGVILAENGEIYDVADEGVEAISWGDVHLREVDPDVRRMAWGPGGMLDTLKPKHQFMHDLLDPPRNHWDMRDPHIMFEQYVEGQERMAAMCTEVVSFLNEESARPWCQTIVVDSNHDNMIERWLREADYRRDPPNALFFLRCQLAKYESIFKKDRNFHLVEHALRSLGCDEGVRFLREDESFVICRDSKGGIECGHHGHLGPNGARGSAQNYAKMGRRVNRCHDHSAGIHDGVFTGGTSSKMDLGFNKGPSSWSNSHIVTYTNGKRCIVTMWNGHWRAE